LLFHLDDLPSAISLAMKTLPSLTAAQAVGAVRHIDDYAEAGARYVNTGQKGAANTQRAYAGDWRRFTT
jgi:hypothetical protein